MREARVIAARKRFSATFFDLRSEAWDHTIHVADYECPACSFTVCFNTSDLFREHRSPFSPAQIAQLESVRPLSTVHFEQAFDFYCPQCDMPVRVIARADDEFAMGCSNWRFVDVVEMVDG